MPNAQPEWEIAAAVRKAREFMEQPKYSNRIIFKRVEARVQELREKYRTLGIDTGVILSNVEFEARSKGYWSHLVSQELDEVIVEECDQYAKELGLKNSVKGLPGA